MKKLLKTIISLILIISVFIFDKNIFTIYTYALPENVSDKILQKISEIKFKGNPGEFSQNTFHPNNEDYFGNYMNIMPIYQVNISPKDETRKNKIALTFDSAYINDYTYKILDILDAYDAKCTFFMTAEWASRNSDHVQEISRRGHEIGNHTVTHPNLNYYNENTAKEEIECCHDVMKEILGGVDMCLFRFPYGSYTKKTLDAVKELGYYPIQWTFDSIDWKNESKDIMLRRFRYTDKLVPGAIVLCHNGATYTPEALPEILEYLKSQNMEFVKVSDLIYKHNFTLFGGLQTHYQDSEGNLLGDDIKNP